MIDAQNIITRLIAQVEGFASVQGALELAALLQSNPQVHVKPRAYVVPLGLRGGAVTSVSGAFLQSVDMSFAVFIAFSAAADRAGARHVDTVGLTQSATINALCGWVPDGSTVNGDCRLARAYLAELKPGAIVYALEFTVPDQIRIIP